MQGDFVTKFASCPDLSAGTSDYSVFSRRLLKLNHKTFLMTITAGGARWQVWREIFYPLLLKRQV